MGCIIKIITKGYMKKYFIHAVQPIIKNLKIIR